MNFDFYGTEVEADDYFRHRLHSECWFDNSMLNRKKALIGATRIIDTLCYKGVKHPLYMLMESQVDDKKKFFRFFNSFRFEMMDRFTPEELQAADDAQSNEFPRGRDTVVPQNIIIANYEIAFNLLDGKDPEIELENLGITSQGLESVRTTYARSQVPIEHIVNGVPSAAAWRLIAPFLREDMAISLRRVR